MKKLTASLVSLVTVGSFSSLNQVLAKNLSKVSTNGCLLTEDKDALKLNDSFEKQKPEFEQKIKFMYSRNEENKKEANTDKKRSIEIKTKEVEALKIFNNLKTENCNLSVFEKTDQDKKDLIAFAVRFNEESKKPGNDILQCFFNALLSEEFKSFPLLKVTNKNGEIEGYIRLYQQLARTEFIPFFLNKSKAKQVLTEVILGFNKRLKEIRVGSEKKLWNINLNGSKKFFSHIDPALSDENLKNYQKALEYEIDLVPFSGESKGSQDYEAFLKEVVESVKKDFSKVITTGTLDDKNKVAYRLVP